MAKQVDGCVTGPRGADAAPPAELRRAAAAPVYRPEIDGLRTVAVVPVVLFHAGMQVFSGGFIGVDVFFVISGYLITGILLNDIAQQRYSIARFYERRARRILPALFTVMLCCIPFAWFTLLPQDFAGFGKSVLAVLGFVSNITFWREEGYFSTASELKPLLHTWSLSVEEQFYVVFPLLLLFLRKADRRTITVVIALGALASLALCEIAAYRFQTANFYLAPTRAWELLGGSLCACIGRQPHVRGAGLLGWLGLAMIVAAIFLFDGALPFPSHFALVPVGGAMLIILFARADAGAGRLLALPPFVGIGLISYSLYLWHQPIFAFARIIHGAHPALPVMLGLALLSGVLAWASWRWIEQPFRKSGGSAEARRSLVLALALAALFGAYGLLSHGVAGRLTPTADPQVQAFVASAHRPQLAGGGCKTTGEGMTEPCSRVPNPNARLRVALFGDSHAEALLPAFLELARQRDVELHYVSVGGCPPLLGGYVINGNAAPPVCAALADKELAVARQARVDVVFLVGRWTLYTQGDPLGAPRSYLLARGPYPFRPNRAESRAALEPLLAATVAAYRAAGIAVVLVDQVPQQDFALDRAVKWMAFRPPAEGIAATIAASAVPVSAFADFRRTAATALDAQAARGASVLRLDPAFRSADRLVWGDAAQSWYYDSSHLSEAGARRLAPAIIAELDQVTRQGQDCRAPTGAGDRGSHDCTR